MAGIGVGGGEGLAPGIQRRLGLLHGPDAEKVGLDEGRGSMRGERGLAGGGGEPELAEGAVEAGGQLAHRRGGSAVELRELLGERRGLWGLHHGARPGQADEQRVQPGEILGGGAGGRLEDRRQAGVLGRRARLLAGGGAREVVGVVAQLRHGLAGGVDEQVGGLEGTRQVDLVGGLGQPGRRVRQRAGERGRVLAELADLVPLVGVEIADRLALELNGLGVSEEQPGERFPQLVEDLAGLLVGGLADLGRDLVEAGGQPLVERLLQGLVLVRFGDLDGLVADAAGLGRLLERGADEIQVRLGGLGQLGGGSPVGLRGGRRGIAGRRLGGDEGADGDGDENRDEEDKRRSATATC
jgi:hypothetical protein